ncbi:response regulator [Cognatilysobacter terrigena]|uniref:response regulator n=1 Tax=Cognatilysobacter terrigena TaxID=2488749 RepID=UPI00105DFCD1|nr:response regulator [Lysobacter terrigena]
MTRRLESRRVLIVEDEFLMADEFARSFEAAGAEVIGPYSVVEDAIEAARWQPLDAAVLDVVLLEESVAPVAALLRARGIPFLFATGVEANCLPGGYESVPVVEKPCDIDELVTALTALVDSRPRALDALRCDTAETDADGDAVYSRSSLG